MTKEQIKKVLYSILIGAIVAGLTSFMEGAIDFLRGWDNNIVGGATASAVFSRMRM